MSTLPTPEDLERLVDPADRRQLYPYDDGRLWYFVKNPSLTLGEVAHAALTEDLERFKKWIQEGEVEIYKSIRDVPGKLFMCIYCEKAYCLKFY